MRRLIRNCKGAVTVMVTLLLIPAILVTGTGVDLTRLYAARSILRDANQLASNSVLADYDALLQDLYGLFAVMQSDGELASMVDEYLKAAVLGEDWFEQGMGTLQLFYGSGLQSTGVQRAPGQTLGDPDVLRRQIEEYVKLRAPVIVAEKILNKLDSFKRVQEDAKIIKKKMEIDDGMEEVDKIYRKIYKCIQNVEKCAEVENMAVEGVNESLDSVHGEFKKMYDLRKDYNEAMDNYEAARANESTWAEAERYLEEAEKLETEYEGRMDNIHAYLTGGEIKAYNDGDVTNVFDEPGLDLKVRNFSIRLRAYIDGDGDGSGDSLETLVELCRKADRKKAELKQDLDEMETSMKEGECSPDLRKGMMGSDSGETTSDSLITQYRKLLGYDLEPMARAMHEKDSAQIEDTITIMENAGLLNATTPYTWPTLAAMGLADFPINSTGGKLTSIKNGMRQTHESAGDGFLRFDSEEFNGTQNAAFYHMLTELCANDMDSAKKQAAKKNVTKIFEKAQNLFKSQLDMSPEGAKYLANAEDGSSAETGTDFGSEGDWSHQDEGKKQLEESMDSDFLSRLTSAAEEMGNKALLLVYDTEMFSDYSSPRLKQGEEPLETMTGTLLGPRVNYYYNSELEYLYNGNLASAEANLQSVAGMILLVRFVFNYIASFMVTPVREVVDAIRTALAATGPFAIVVSELARMGMAIGESAMDVERLRRGERVALLKNDDEWKFSIRGFAGNILGDIGEVTLDAADGGGGREEGDGRGLYYTDYLRLFLLLVDGNLLARRTANLIELNVTNYRDGINAKPDRMASADRVDLSKAITGFSLTSTVELRMLFLSMPFAQEGVDGVIPPKTLPLSVTDYRGY